MAWSAGYKRKIDCGRPRGFSQKAHCASKKKAGKRKSERKLSASAARLDANGDGRITGADFKFKLQAKPKPKPKPKPKSK